MSGKDFKEKVLLKGIPITEIAAKLGITAQGVNSYFKVKDVSSGTIERIADALGVTMAFFYPEDYESKKPSVKKDCSNLEEKVEMLMQILAEKERTIQILMSK